MITKAEKEEMVRKLRVLLNEGVKVAAKQEGLWYGAGLCHYLCLGDIQNNPRPYSFVSSITGRWGPKKESQRGFFPIEGNGCHHYGYYNKWDKRTRYGKRRFSLAHFLLAEIKKDLRSMS